ncbi:MAG TPA: asparagine synthase (glutamine-hydrolyzing), partial [Gammaproteobacteria bacterium]|nr:asparagine synthase (glutamine-hydrolyzing) [Gammaproteobacteria bacterium]
MCGIAGLINLRGEKVPRINRGLRVMNALQEHRGPDDDGVWVDEKEFIGLAHRRLSIIDLSSGGRQPMLGLNGAVITYNGEIYNFLELRQQLSAHWQFRTNSDTETILAAYEHYGYDCVDHLRGMFAFAIWDPRKHVLFCARDRFGIKPFYHMQVGDTFYFASEIKALMPFLPEVNTDPAGLVEYLTFQYTIGANTLFQDIRQLEPAHTLVVSGGRYQTKRYWDVSYDINLDRSPAYFENRLRELLDDSVRVHMRSDVPIGSYLSGGIDSSLIAILA